MIICAYYVHLFCEVDVLKKDVQGFFLIYNSVHIFTLLDQQQSYTNPLSLPDLNNIN